MGEGKKKKILLLFVSECYYLNLLTQFLLCLFTSTESRDRHNSKHHHRDKDRDRSERKERSQSQRSEKSYREWDETPTRFRDEPLTPQGRLRGQLHWI